MLPEPAPQAPISLCLSPRKAPKLLLQGFGSRGAASLCPARSGHCPGAVGTQCWHQRDTQGHPGRAGPTLSLAEGIRLHQTNSLRGRCGAGQRHKAGQAGPDSPPQLKEKAFQSLTASPAMSALLHSTSPALYLRVAVLTQTRSGCGPC